MEERKSKILSEIDRDREELESSGAEIVAEKPKDLLKIYEELNYDKTGCK